MDKQCKTCKEVKSFDSFSRAKGRYISECKACRAAYVRRYNKTLPGVITSIYGGERSASKQRKHPAPAYTKSELTTFLFANGIEALFDTWKKSGFQKELYPSVDRLDSTKPYTMDNIRLVTWKENNDANYEDRLSGKRITTQNVQVVQMDLEGNTLDTFHSIAAAARALGFCRTNINTAINKGKIAHGYLWCKGEI